MKEHSINISNRNIYSYTQGACLVNSGSLYNKYADDSQEEEYISPLSSFLCASAK